MAAQLVVFDMAGTTVKDENSVGFAFQRALATHGFKFTLQDINQYMGYAKPIAIQKLLEKHEPPPLEITNALISRIHGEFVKEMINFYKTSPDVVALPHVEETFAALHKAEIKVALDTGFSKSIADVIVDRLGWRKANGDVYIDHMVASDEVERGRPFPDMIEKIKADLGIDKSAIIAKVGDTAVDIEEGKNSGCKYVIGITTGTFTSEELEACSPTHIVCDIFDVASIVTCAT